MRSRSFSSRLVRCVLRSVLPGVFVTTGAATALAAQGSTPPPPTPRGGAPTVVVPTTSTAAQDAASRALGRRVSNEEIAGLLTRSGLSEAQVRVRLEQAGYDGRLAEPFFTAMRGDRAALQRPADSAFVAALVASELVTADAFTADDATATAQRAVDARTPAERAAEAVVFGKSLFADRGAAFDPVRVGPVDPAYRLGPGDVVQVVLTGDVEASYTVDVRSDGALLLPRLGQVGVAGLTVEAARASLRTVAQRSYDGISSGRVRLDLAVTRVRTIAVLVVGEVEHPGTVQVNGGGTVLHALGRAGGPTVRGSFRAVELRRGGTLVATIDLYDLLLRGDLASDKRLEQGDVIHVPLVSRTVGMVGAFRRPSTFEMKGTERFADALRFAGGFSVDAANTRVQIDRVLPTAQRTPGRSRVLLDVPLFAALPAALDTMALLDGDVVTAFHLDEVRRNHVAIAGEVHMPGRYELTNGLTLGDLVTRAEGATPWALVDRVKVVRTVPRTGRTENFSLDVATAEGRGFRLQEFDSVSVLDGRLLYPSGTITVSGAVHAPRRVAHATGLSLVDAVDVAGGLTDEAQLVEVSRRPRAARYTDTAAIVLRVPATAVRSREGEAMRFMLERDDQVQVRASPGYRALSAVSVSGLFTYPGTYFLQRDNERLSELLARAGGLQPTAYHPSFRLIRGGRVVAVDLDRALQQDPQANIALLAGDQLRIGPDPGVVYVTGAVERQVAVPYRRGLKMEDYLSAAGGVAQLGDASKVLIELPSGEVLRPRRGRFVVDQNPAIPGGSTITVLTRRERVAGQWSQNLTTIAQVATSLVSLVLAYVAVTRNN